MVKLATGIKKVGHAGTLDPMATGVLVIGTGEMGKLTAQHLRAQGVGEIAIRGNTVTHESVIRRQLFVAPGERFLDLRASRERAVGVSRRIGVDPSDAEPVDDHDAGARALAASVYDTCVTIGADRVRTSSASDRLPRLDAWYARMDGAWEFWLDGMSRFRALVAALIGCGRPDAVVPRVSAGQGLRAGLNALPAEAPRVVATRCEFDSVDFILKTYEHRGRADLRWVATDERGLVRPESVAAAIDARKPTYMASPPFRHSVAVSGEEKIRASPARPCQFSVNAVS